MVLKDSSEMKATLFPNSEIPKELSEDNQELIKFALTGYETTPKKILLYVMDSAGEVADEYAKMLKYFETVKINWLVVASVKEDSKTADIVAWVKKQRQEKHTVKAVLPSVDADTEGVVNVDSSLFIGEKEYPPEKAAVRVAGLLAGTPITISCAYAPLRDFTDCTRLDREALDAAVDAGKFVFMWDGEKVKVCRGVTSMTTVSDTKGKNFSKIKIVEAMDMIQDDITITAQDSYIGKYPNTYDNKCLLITAINEYFNELVRSGVIQSGTCEIDIEAQRKYLEENGMDTQDMSDQEIKEANTGSHVFLRAMVSILDAIEDIDLVIYI